jgi:hypothetical protein
MEPAPQKSGFFYVQIMVDLIMNTNSWWWCKNFLQIREKR